MKILTKNKGTNSKRLKAGENEFRRVFQIFVEENLQSIEDVETDPKCIKHLASSNLYW